MQLYALILAVTLGSLCLLALVGHFCWSRCVWKLPLGWLRSLALLFLCVALVCELCWVSVDAALGEKHAVLTPSDFAARPTQLDLPELYAVSTSAVLLLLVARARAVPARSGKIFQTRSESSFLVCRIGLARSGSRRHGNGHPKNAKHR
jgi:hypothetical protein